jgi:DNA-binding transcriptional LysR family regulator
MELRHLRYFTAVVECKGYREASRQLHIAQPSISEAVSDLERELGLKLFSRTHRNARLTPEGEIFYADAVRILQQTETAILTAKRAAQGKVGRLSIGFIGSATLSFLPDLIRRYKLEFPNVKLLLHDLYPVELENACDRGEIDIAITRTLSPERSKNRQSKVLLRDPLVGRRTALHSIRQSRQLRRRTKPPEETNVDSNPIVKSRCRCHVDSCCLLSFGILSRLQPLQRKIPTLRVGISCAQDRLAR